MAEIRHFCEFRVPEIDSNHYTTLKCGPFCGPLGKAASPILLVYHAKNNSMRVLFWHHFLSPDLSGDGHQAAVQSGSTPVLAGDRPGRSSGFQQKTHGMCFFRCLLSGPGKPGNMTTLTPLQITAAKQKAKPDSLSDGEGLALSVQPSSAKLWRFRYRGCPRTLN